MNLPAHTWRRNSNAVARSWNWSADNITIQQLMTHAEAASNRDGRVMHKDPLDGFPQRWAPGAPARPAPCGMAGTL